MDNVTYAFMTTTAENSSFIVVRNITRNDVRSQGSAVIFKVVFTLVLVLIMFGMGCAVNHRTLLENLRRPIGIGVGLSCQIILMPVLTYALIKISGMKTIQAIAFMLVGCSPGGSNSNVVTYLIKGDISLSVAMTTSSNILALGTVPLFVLVFTMIENIEGSLTIPYWSIAISLLAIGIPIGFGIAFRYKFPERARNIPKICAGIAVVILIVAIISIIVVRKMTFYFSLNTILPVGILPFFGMGISYLICCIPAFELSTGAKKAIAMETMLQNAGLSNSVIMLTYGNDITLVGEAITIPLLYNVAQTVLLLIVVIGYRLLLCRKSGRKNSPPSLVKPMDSSETQPFTDFKNSNRTDEKFVQSL